MGDRLSLLEAACDRLCEVFGDLHLSQVYETEPVGCPAGSPLYLNACVEVMTSLLPIEVLTQTSCIERELGRSRNGTYGEPRTCDIDILYYDDLEQEDPQLTLPHPRAHQRAFVLKPLCDLDPQLILPGQKATVQQLLAECPDLDSVKAYPL